MELPAFLASPVERRVALFYFVTAMPLGAASVHASIWFAEQGIDSTRIGIINSAPVLVMIALNLAIGRIADRASDWRQTIVVAAAFQGLVTFGLFLVDGFWGILAVWTLSITPNQAIAPVLDAASTRLTRRNGTSFGPLRACATVGYVLMVATTGVLIETFGGGIFVPFYVALMAIKALTAQILPRFRAPQGSSAVADEAGAARLAEVMQPWFVLPLLGFAMVFGTHLVLNAFAALYWSKQGIDSDVISHLIAIGAVAEAAMMFSWARAGRWFAPEQALLLAGSIAALRWLAMGFAPPVSALVFLQLLHAITFAMGYLACVQFIAGHTHDRIAAEAQSFYMILQQVMAVIAVTGFGWISARIGIAAYFVASAFAGFGAAIILGGILLARSRTRRECCQSHE